MYKKPARRDGTAVRHRVRRIGRKLPTAFTSALLLLSLGQVSFTQATQLGSLDPDFNAQWYTETDSISRDFIQSGRLFSANDVQRIYEQNSYRPLWTNRIEDEIWFADAREAFDELKYDALPMWRYHREQFTLLKGLPKKSWLLDVYLTDALVTAINDLTGQLLPKDTQHEEWKLNRKPVNLGEIISSLRYGNSVSAVFQHERPAHSQYELLRHAYKRMLGRTQKLTLSDGDKLQRHSTGKRVLQLARLLESEGLFHLDDIDSDKPEFNEFVEQAVIDFQRLRGITPDGVVGKNTRALLNSGPDEIATKIALNLQRWRTVAGNFPSSHILVNTAAYKMELIDDGEKALEMNVVVGKRSRQTPSFSETMTHVVLNPNWNIPPRITREEILPKIRKDRNFASKLGIRAMAGSKPVSWSSISDNQLHSRKFPYTLQQVAGDRNALGRYKFLFPNQYMVYLHDTPYKSLFARDKRAFSHGCVRLEEPKNLAEYLLAKNGWDEMRIRRTIDRGQSKHIRMVEPLPVYLLYLTTWVNEDGRLEVYPDTYLQDQTLQDNLLALDDSLSVRNISIAGL